jgi:two-component system, OmpR family, sensor kinase
LTLRLRLGLAVAAFAAAIVVLFGAWVHLTYRHQLEAQLIQVLLHDLERVATLLDRPTLGASFVGADARGDVLQFIGMDGSVLIGWGDPIALPAVERPATIVRGGRTYLTASAPWPAADGSIRLAHDVTDAFAAVAEIGRLLWGIGTAVVLLAALAALVLVRRMLGPLADLARQTRSLDPATSEDVVYRGPRDEGHDLATGLNDAMGAVRRRRDEERALLLEVAHELAAPLTLVHYHLDGLRRGDPGDARLRAASDAARELLRTSQDLLVVARGELERTIEPRLLDLREVVERIAAEYPGIAVEAAEPAEVVGDPERLMQVVRNVVRNAVQVTGAAERVRVLVRGEAETYVVEVCDDGPGMGAEARARAFERGFSGGRGAGVGLAVARSLVEAHGGSLEVASSTPDGTVMAIRLPSLASRLEIAPADPAVSAGCQEVPI